MKRTCFFLSILFLIPTTLIGAEEAALPSPPADRSIRLSHCLVSLIDDVEVSAEKPGVLTVLDVKEGDYIERSAPMATPRQHAPRRARERSAQSRVGASWRDIPPSCRPEQSSGRWHGG